LRVVIAQIQSIQKRGGCQAAIRAFAGRRKREQGYTLVTGVEFREIKREVATTRVLQRNEKGGQRGGRPA
jgi:hypothetical protein